MNDKKLSTVKLDGIDYEAAPEVANALSKAQAEAASLKVKLDAADAAGKVASDKLVAERDALKAKLDGFETRDIAAEILAGVKARTSLIATAGKAGLDAETAGKVDGMADDEIRRAVIAKRLPAMKLDGYTPEQVRIAYDAAVAGLDNEAKDHKHRQDALALGRELSAPRLDGGGSSTTEAAKAAEDRINKQWQPAA